MKMIHVIPHVDHEAAGPSYSVPRLCESLAVRGHDVELSCLASRLSIPGVKIDLHPQLPFFGKFAVSPRHACSLRRKADGVDIVHNHSLWSMVNVAAGWVVPGSAAKLVTSPRGTLSPWALKRSRLLKQLLWPLQRRVLARADLLHATSDTEHGEIRAQGFRGPVAVIPNGIDLPEPGTRCPAGDGRTLLFLSRIHPTKAIDRLLHAWLRVQAAHPDWRLVVAGTGEPEHVREIENLSQALRLERIEFPGPLYGPAKSRAYLEADLFVLPTHTENFGMVVAEALAHACPVVVSRGAPWSGVEREGCGWWVSNDPETLASALGRAMRLTRSERASMGLKGRIWMQREFGWSIVAARMEAAYEWLARGGKAPGFIHTL